MFTPPPLPPPFNEKVKIFELKNVLFGIKSAATISHRGAVKVEISKMKCFLLQPFLTCKCEIFTNTTF